MASIEGPARDLIDQGANHAVVSTLNEDGSIHSAVVWANVEDGKVAVNSAVGRKWPRNLERDPTINVTVYDQSNPYEYVEVRGRATGSTGGADDHIDRLAKKYLDADSYPFRQEGEQRISFFVDADRVRHQKQG